MKTRSDETRVVVLLGKTYYWLVGDDGRYRLKRLIIQEPVKAYPIPPKELPA